MRTFHLVFTALLGLALTAGTAHAQDPPSTDLWLVPLPASLDLFTPSDATNLTDRDGYDNQPMFLPDGSGLLYTSFQDGQTDIYHYDLAAQVATPVTRTPESEYSATPYGDASRFSVIRVEADGMQRLWSFDRDGQTPQLVLEDVAPVGYHAWSTDRTLGLFVLGEPPTFQVADATTGQSVVHAGNIGRSLHRIPGTDHISFAQRTDDAWQLMRYVPTDNRVDTLTAPAGPAPHPQRSAAMDYAWHPSGAVLTVYDGVLYAWTEGSWEALADLSAVGLTDVTRLTVHPEGRALVVVAARNAAP
ncbi:MAG: hypothetical protein AAF970_07020 [Bacteroidota bacterium]